MIVITMKPILRLGTAISAAALLLAWLTVIPKYFHRQMTNHVRKRENIVG